MAKTIYAGTEDREKHRSLTEVLGLIDLEIVKYESDDEEKKDHAGMCATLGS